MAVISSDSPASQPVILLVDDDETMRLVCSSVLRSAGYDVIASGDGEDALAQLKKSRVDLMLLDVEMPKLDGWATLERLRQSGYRQPVLMLTGRLGLDDKVRGLGIGADDYLVKPCDHRELLARVNAALRRAKPPEPELPMLYFDAIAVDLVNRAARKVGEKVSLTKTEYAVLEVLARQPSQTVTRETLLEKVWGYVGEVNTRTVETTIWRLRQKIGDSGENPRWIKTAPAGGYILSQETLKPAAGVLYDRRKV